MPPGDMSSCAAMLLVMGPGLNGEAEGLVGVEVEAAILLVIGPGLTGASETKIVEGVDAAWATEVVLLDVLAFLDFLEVFLDVGVLASFFLFLHSNNLVKPLCSHRDFIVTKWEQNWREFQLT